MKSPRRSYHHGEVQKQAVHAAISVLDAGGADSITMREIAARIGTDHRALYRHFEDRDGVLRAVAARCLEDLLKAMETGGAGPSALHADFAVYIGFALEYPHRHHLMLTRSRAQIDADPVLGRAMQLLLSRLMQSARSALDVSGPSRDADAKELAFSGLAAAYGLLTLAKTSTLAPRSPDALRAFLTQQVFGVLDGQILRLQAPERAQP